MVRTQDFGMATVARRAQLHRPPEREHTNKPIKTWPRRPDRIVVLFMRTDFGSRGESIRGVSLIAPSLSPHPQEYTYVLLGPAAVPTTKKTGTVRGRLVPMDRWQRPSLTLCLFDCVNTVCVGSAEGNDVGMEQRML